MQDNPTRSARSWSRNRGEPLVQRQARVGIIANPATVSLPVSRPRDTWVRWPDLRSARRIAGGVAGRAPAGPAADPTLNGSALNTLARAFREDCPAIPDDAPRDSDTSEVNERERVYRAVLADMSDAPSVPDDALKPAASVRLVQWCGLGLLCVAIALILLSFLNG